MRNIQNEKKISSLWYYDFILSAHFLEKKCFVSRVVNVLSNYTPVGQDFKANKVSEEGSKKHN